MVSEIVPTVSPVMAPGNGEPTSIRRRSAADRARPSLLKMFPACFPTPRSETTRIGSATQSRHCQHGELELAVSRPRNVHSGRNRSRIPAEGAGSRWLARTSRARRGQAEQNLAREGVVTRMPGRRLQRIPLAPRLRTHCGTHPEPQFCLVSAHSFGDTSDKSDCLRAVTHSNGKVFE